MKKCSVLLRTTLLGLLVVCASGQFFPPPSAFYPFPTWVAYPFQNPQYKPPSNFTYNATSFNNTYWKNPKYFPFYNYSQHNNSVQYGGNLFVGYIWPIDRLLFNQSFIKQSRWWASREKIVEYPGYLPPGLIRNETITAIRVYDHHLNGNIGYPSILSGGVGFNFVKIRLYSGGVGRGFNFLVQIFGH